MGEGSPCFLPELSLSSFLEGCELSHHSLPPSFGPLPLGQAPLQRTHGQTGQSGGVLVYETRDPVLLVSGKVRHTQGQSQRLNRFEVRRKRESERTKGEGEKSTLFPLFPTPHFKLNLKVSIG
jgi:hypothetical protein